MALTAVVIVATLGLFDLARGTYRAGDGAAEQQQAARVALDLVTAHLRMAGHNVNPDGSVTRPDEPIEAAFDTAIVIRGDFDAEDPDAAPEPETVLAGGAYSTVSTGNDEVVAYVLAAPDGSSDEALTFEADVKDVPRDGAVETVRLQGVALRQTDPPYTLYRVTLNPDVSRWGTGAFTVRTPVIENVASLTFRYLDVDGETLNPRFDPTTTADDIGGDEAGTSRASRARIRRIEVDLVTLSRHPPDPRWVDSDDPNPRTRSLRKLRLRVTVVPRSLGLPPPQSLEASLAFPGIRTSGGTARAHRAEG